MPARGLARAFRLVVCALLIPLAVAAHAAESPAVDAAQTRLILDVTRAGAAEGLDAANLPADATAAAIGYASDQHGGRLPLSDFPRDWAIRPPPYDASADFAQAVSENRLAAWLASLPPPDPRYARLVKAYGRYRTIASQGGWAVLATKTKLKIGDAGEAIEALRRRLAVEDPDTPPGPAVFDAALAAAVARAQARHGLTADGRVGPATVAALNVPVEARLLQIRANLERWRWAPRTLPPFRIEINTADASLKLFDPVGGDLAMRAVVGRAGWPTPMFQDAVKALVFNPPWNVPADIAAKEVWPKIRRQPGYRARERFVVRPGGGLQQLPGPRCALGALKFDLSNPFGVYLHDTPARSLFALDQRALSHGCMRLQNPIGLGKRLLAGDADWPETRIDATLAGGETTHAPLKRPVPLFVFHWTAFVDDSDQLQFRPDVYGWDEDLRVRLERHGRAL